MPHGNSFAGALVWSAVGVGARPMSTRAFGGYLLHHVLGSRIPVVDDRRTGHADSRAPAVRCSTLVP